MAKVVTRKYSLSAEGVLYVNGSDIVVENSNNGNLIKLQDLLSDFLGKSVKIAVSYSEDYE